MPMPKPKKGESQDDWKDRCMDNEQMKKDFTDNKQRLAVCFDIWGKKDKQKKENQMENIEYRSFPLEVRVEGDDKKKIVGYAAMFDKWSDDLGGFKEIIRKGAFRKTIKEKDVRALFNHSPNYVLGRTKSGTLELKEDKTGLAINNDPPTENPWVQGLMESIDRGDIDQMSFGFRTIKDSWRHPENKKEPSERELLEVELFDVSIVTFPAYPQTSVAVRSLDMDELNKVCFKIEKGIDLSEEDRLILEATEELISEHLPEPVQADHSEDKSEGTSEPIQADHSEIKRQIAIKRKKLRLKEVEV